jgi:hypothetical protein
MKKVLLAVCALTLAGSVMAAPAVPVGIDPPFAADSISASVPGDIDPPFAPDLLDAFGDDIDPPFV